MSNKRKLGLLTFSDGRKAVHEELLAVNKKFHDEVVSALEATGEVEVVSGETIIHEPFLLYLLQLNKTSLFS
ncbi:unnamed protein product [marine sediment metagenome]|uniref:L-fucose isomerase N-terminal-1 domain-containing protein n=1 Tax=marine sediment metagenome TaxID=412755 RepID=X1LCF4_9ZZZZ